MGKYETERPLRIGDVIGDIRDKKYLLPAIQRSFVWDESRIIRLFDSILRNYPINTLMIWNLKGETKSKNKFKLYEFIQDFCRYWGCNENPLYDHTMAPTEEVSVVIDGQQRLTSLYIGLDGFYCGKQSAGSYPKSRDFNKYPQKELYLNLAHDLDPNDNELQLKYDFKFFSLPEREKEAASEWFKVKFVREMKDFSNLDALERSDKIGEYLLENNLLSDKRAIGILNKLYETVRMDEKLSYYKITDQDMDFVLDVFLRTNGGGVPLTFSELIFAMTVDYWGDGRDSIDRLVKNIKAEYDFTISRDFVMKTLLTLFAEDVKFSVASFSGEIIEKIKENWDDVEKAVKAAFSLIKKLGFNDTTVRAKNAIILIVYYIFAHQQFKLNTTENNDTHEIIRADITKWLSLVLITGQFGGQSDSVIKDTRAILKAHGNSGMFPLKEIIEKFAGNQRKSLNVTHEYIEKLVLKTQKDSAVCYPLLALLFPEYPKKFQCDIDHMHPASSFERSKLEAIPQIANDAEMLKFYLDKSNWNALPNLQLMGSSDNKAKNKDDLDRWLREKCKSDIDKDNMLIPKDEDDQYITDFLKFKHFFEKRKGLLIKKLEIILSGSIDDTLEEIYVFDDELDLSLPENA